MYESYFGLTGLPFQLTPDRAFLFQSKGYRSALAALQEGLATGAPVMVVTGEPGAGKTTLVQALLASAEATSMAAVHISSSGLDGQTLVDRLSDSLALPQAPKPSDRHDAVVARLVSRGLATLLVIDEAQHLCPSALELLETLAKAAAEAAAPLHICLLGQPELRIQLNATKRSGLRELIGVDRHLGPLAETEIRLYVEHRLHCAGWTGRPEFEDAAFVEIFVFTTGMPRRVNLLCNSLLLAAWLNREQRIDAPAVTRAAGAIRGDSYPPVTGLLEAEDRDAPMLTEAVEPVAAKSAAVEETGGEAARQAESEAARRAGDKGALQTDADAALETKGDAPSESINARSAGLVHRHEGAALRRRWAIVASAASVVIALTMIAYVFDRQPLRAGLTQSELRNVAAKRVAGSAVPAAAPAQEPRTSAAGSLATAQGPSPTAELARPARAEGVPEQATAVSPTDSLKPPSCSSAAFALGLCDAESSTRTRSN